MDIRKRFIVYGGMLSNGPFFVYDRKQGMRIYKYDSYDRARTHTESLNRLEAVKFEGVRRDFTAADLKLAGQDWHD